MNDIQYRRMRVFRKVVIITVLVLLVIWFIFFMRLGIRMNDKQKDTNFNNNVAIMELAAREYFDSHIDQNKKIISLKKMYELNLLDKLKTSFGKECYDMVSFAKVIELDKKYQLDILLVCGNDDKTKTTFYDLNCGFGCKEM